MRQEKYFYTHSFPFLFLYSRTGKVQIIGSPTTTLFSSENVPSNFSAKLPVALSRLIALSREAVVVIIFGSNSGPPPALVEKKFIDGEPEIGVAYMHARNSTTRLVHFVNLTVHLDLTALGLPATITESQGNQIIGSLKELSSDVNASVSGLNY